LKKYLFLFISILLHFSGNSQESILYSELKLLSSDQLKGRENGSQEIYETALWIAKKFNEIGLIAPDYTQNYLQEISLIKSKKLTQNLILNGFPIPDDRFFVLGQFEKFNLFEPGDTKVFIVGEKDDMMRIFSEIQNFENSYIVLIHPSQQNRFERLKRYFTSPNLELENENNYFSLWVLTDESSIESISLNVRNKIERKSIYNVIGELPSEKSNDRKWIFSAHYDHIGVINPIDGDSIANGANDDATGVAAVIELARKFSSGEKVDKSILFVAFAGEELGLFGSRYLSTTLDLSTIEAMLSFEMIGIPNEDLGPQSAYITGYDLSYLPKQLALNSMESGFMIFPDPYPNLNLFKRSDNASFAAYGIAAHSISSYKENDENYHTVNDEFENLDIEHIEELIEAVYISCLPLLKLEYSPGIIDYKTKNDR